MRSLLSEATGRIYSYATDTRDSARRESAASAPPAAECRSLVVLQVPFSFGSCRAFFFVVLGVIFGLRLLITLPMLTPTIYFNTVVGIIGAFQVFGAAFILTSGGPGSTTEVASITLKRAAFESWRTGYSSAFAIILFVTVFGLANIYVKALNRVKSR